MRPGLNTLVNLPPEIAAQVAELRREAKERLSEADSCAAAGQEEAAQLLREREQGLRNRAATLEMQHGTFALWDGE